VAEGAKIRPPFNHTRMDYTLGSKGRLFAKEYDMHAAHSMIKKPLRVLCVSRDSKQSFCCKTARYSVERELREDTNC
jgi:hypothetical protein